MKNWVSLGGKNKRAWQLLAVFAALLLQFVLATAWADDDFDLGTVDPDLPAKIKTWNADCLSCHSQQGVEHPPRAGMDLKLLSTLTIDQGHFEHSDHGKMACRDCHGEGYIPYPHKDGAKKLIKDCVSCHQAPAKTIMPEFKASTHFKGHSDRFTCNACHEPHLMRKGTSFHTGKEAAASDNGSCLACHDDDKRYLALMKPGSKRPDIAAAHNWLPEEALHMQQVRCVDCHSPMADVGSLSHEVQQKDKAVRACEACHDQKTELGGRLYKTRMRDGEAHWGGFDNAPLLQEIYVVGANRNNWLDWVIGGLLALTVALLTGRWLIRRRRARKGGL